MLHWHALYTKPKKEHEVVAGLERRGIETYLPTVRRRLHRRDRPDQIVYFPCYLFARLDLDSIPRSSIQWMPGIRNIVGAGDRPAVVPEEVVALIRRRLGDVEQLGFGRLAPGERVRITAGPFRDLEAVFDRDLPSADRVRILLDVLGRQTPVEMHRSQVAGL